jgi:chromosome segregation ATPase
MCGSKLGMESVSQKIHAAYESALMDAGVSYPRVLCPVCRSCKVCGVQRAEERPASVGLLQNPRRKRPEKIITSEKPSQEDTIESLKFELSSALARIDNLSALNLRSYEDLADEKNRSSKLKKIFEDTRQQLSSLQSQEKLYLERISKLEASLKLSEACRSQTTKEMKRSKLEARSLQREVNEVKSCATLNSLPENRNSQIVFSCDDHEKSRQILVTVENDLRELIQLICQWNRSLESVFMTQPNHEQEWLGLLNGLCLSIFERIDIVNHLLEQK